MAKPALARVEDSKRERIFAIAAEEFARRGFYGASVDEMARRAGIAKGAVYLYFESKLDLYQETLRAGARRLDRLFERIRGGGGSVVEQLRMLYELAAEAVIEHPAEWRMYCDLVNTNDPDLIEMARELEASSARFYRELVDKGRERGDVRRDLPAPVLAYMLDSTFVQFFAASVSGYQAERLRTFWPEVADPAAALAEKSSAVLAFVAAGVRPQGAAALQAQERKQ